MHDRKLRGRKINAFVTSSTAKTLAATILLLFLPFSITRAVDQTTPQVLDVFPHDTGAFTQGLLFHQDLFYESTGLYGQSTLRRVDPATGAVLSSINLSGSEFGEGLARVGDELIQITWRENVAHRYSLVDFSPIGNHVYAGEGWGICHDGQRLVMSNGSSVLTLRDVDDFHQLSQVQVTRDGIPVGNLNELECVGRLVYANVWLTDTILRIDPRTGVVLTEIDAAGLLTPAEAQQANVLNGIAFHPATERFYLTGKLWPKVFEVDFDFNPYGGCEQIDTLDPINALRLSKDGPNHIVFTWEPDESATEYHVNSVATVSDLAAPGPHLPDRTGAAGSPACDAPPALTTCTEINGQLTPQPLVFYQAFSACGPGGIDEGPL